MDVKPLSQWIAEFQYRATEGSTFDEFFKIGDRCMDGFGEDAPKMIVPTNPVILLERVSPFGDVWERIE